MRVLTVEYMRVHKAQPHAFVGVRTWKFRYGKGMHRWLTVEASWPLAKERAQMFGETYRYKSCIVEP